MGGSVRTPTHLWIVGAMSAVWNAFGCFDYVMTQARNQSYLAHFSEAQRAYFESYPAWADAAWACGVWGALAGSLLLLARSRFAVHAFGVSLAGLLVSTIYQYAMTTLPKDMVSDMMIVMSVLIWAVAVGLLAYAWLMNARGVLR